LAKRTHSLIFFLIAASLLLGACASGGSGEASNAVLTEAALIAAQGLTQTAAVVPPTATPTQVPPTATATQPQPTATQAATTGGATSGQATATVQPQTGGNVGCLRANLEIETIPDGEQIPQEKVFTKTWRLKNVGSCTWTPAFSLVFIQGDLMGAKAVIAFSDFTDLDIPPNGYVMASVELAAPKPAGHYKGYWMLRSADGITFGLGSNGRDWFWVDIESMAPQP
jgi:hypothetical protein